MRSTSRGRVGVGAAILLGITWGLSSGTASLGAPAVIKLTAKEWRYEPGEISSSAGEVTFEVNNGGLIEHNFVVVDAATQKRAEIPYIESGQTLLATSNLPPGVYTIYCGLPGHRDAGMVATLRVR